MYLFIDPEKGVLTHCRENLTGVHDTISNQLSLGDSSSVRSFKNCHLELKFIPKGRTYLCKFII
jgi:hypothetical protein